MAQKYIVGLFLADAGLFVSADCDLDALLVQ
jgi:hypothetical protein